MNDDELDRAADSLRTAIEEYMASPDFAARHAIACNAMEQCGSLTDAQLAELLGLPEAFASFAMKKAKTDLFKQNGGLQ